MCLKKWIIKNSSRVGTNIKRQIKIKRIKQPTQKIAASHWNLSMYVNPIPSGGGSPRTLRITFSYTYSRFRIWIKWKIRKVKRLLHTSIPTQKRKVRTVRQAGRHGYVWDLIETAGRCMSWSGVVPGCKRRQLEQDITYWFTCKRVASHIEPGWSKISNPIRET